MGFALHGQFKACINWIASQSNDQFDTCTKQISGHSEVVHQMTSLRHVSLVNQPDYRHKVESSQLKQLHYNFWHIWQIWHIWVHKQFALAGWALNPFIKPKEGSFKIMHFLNSIVTCILPLSYCLFGSVMVNKGRCQIWARRYLNIFNWHLSLY